MKHFKLVTILLLCALLASSCGYGEKAVSVIREDGSILTEHVEDLVYYARLGNKSVRFELGEKNIISSILAKKMLSYVISLRY